MFQQEVCLSIATLEASYEGRKLVPNEVNEINNAVAELSDM